MGKIADKSGIVGVKSKVASRTKSKNMTSPKRKTKPEDTETRRLSTRCRGLRRVPYKLAMAGAPEWDSCQSWGNLHSGSLVELYSHVVDFVLYAGC